MTSTDTAKPFVEPIMMCAHVMRTELKLSYVKIAAILDVSRASARELHLGGIRVCLAQPVDVVDDLYRAALIVTLHNVIRRAQGRIPKVAYAADIAFAAQRRLDELNGLPAKMKARYGVVR
jgi:hypothetical protein